MTFLNERYRIVKCIQRHADTNVYLVEDQLLAKNYVAKETLKSAHSLLIHQFRVEVDVLSQLSNPHMPQIIDVFETKTSYVLIETYLEGSSLSDFLSSCPKASYRLYKKWILDCIDMLGHIHELGYLYIDLKKENLMIVDDKIYLIDFNSCILKENSSVYYASNVNYAPELKKGIAASVKTDIYGLGGIIELLYKKGFNHFLSKLCRQKNVKKRISSLKTVKRLFLFGCICEKFFNLLTLSALSVLLLIFLLNQTHVNPLEKYLHDQSPILFMDAYAYTLNQQKGIESSKISNNLYRWIDEEWLDDDLFKDKECATFILKQALKSKNISLCSYLLTKIDTSLKKDLDDLILTIKVYTAQDQSISTQDIQGFVQSIKSKNLSLNQKIEKVQILLNVLHECEIVIDQDDLDGLYTIINSFKTEHESFEDVASSYLSYGIVIQDEDLDFKIPASFKRFFKDDVSIMEIINYLGG